jgi:hypothetical protein
MGLAGLFDWLSSALDEERHTDGRGHLQNFAGRGQLAGSRIYAEFHDVSGKLILRQ